jgi:hypothetical protein
MVSAFEAETIVESIEKERIPAKNKLRNFILFIIFLYFQRVSVYGNSFIVSI